MRLPIPPYPRGMRVWRNENAHTRGTPRVWRNEYAHTRAECGYGGMRTHIPAKRALGARGGKAAGCQYNTGGAVCQAGGAAENFEKFAKTPLSPLTKPQGNVIIITIM